jgi:anti-sigma B factor antagonist
VQATLEQPGNVTVVVLDEDYLDASNSKEFKQNMQRHLEPGSKLVLDLSAVRFVDSSGCGAILTCMRQLTTAGGDFKLCGISKQVRALFELVRMHRVMDIFNTREEAVRAF